MDSAQSGWKLFVPVFSRAREERVELCSVSPLCLCGFFTLAEAPQPLTFLCSNPVGLSLGMLDLSGEHPVDAMALGQSSAEWQVEEPSPWLAGTQHGEDLLSLMEAKA